MTPTELMLLRKQYGLTQAELGARLSPPVSRLTVSNWERARFAIPHDIAARMLSITPSTAKVKTNAKLTRDTIDAYRGMRKDFSHADIIAMWARRGFTPDLDAQAGILEAFPELNAGKAV